MDEREWYSVKCIFEHQQGGPATMAVYEERVIILRASSSDDAIEQAENEAQQYIESGGSGSLCYAGFLSVYRTDQTELTDKMEVYSVMRETTLSREAFLTHYYDDGTALSRLTEGGNLVVRLAEPSDRLAIKNMIELYLHDLSEYRECDELDVHGQYGYALDHYWDTPNHFAFVLLVQERYVGFALVDNAVVLPENDRRMGPFFVLRRYRRGGIGTIAAQFIFDTLPGQWEVGQDPANLTAQAFWRKVLREYTNNQFSELPLESWEGALQSFDNRERHMGVAPS